eukprot:SAG11_NODE_6760_length_1252_cov_2.751084_1_plen_68_part_10
MYTIVVPVPTVRMYNGTVGSKFNTGYPGTRILFQEQNSCSVLCFHTMFGNLTTASYAASPDGSSHCAM